jgi:uncharacterized protein YndB with AHSA1/START domain
METGKAAVLIEKTINAPLEEVWKAWTDPALIKNWFGSDLNGKVLNAKLDVQPGCSFEITFVDSDLTEHTCSGIYHEVQKFSKLSFSWMWKSEPGIESDITLMLTAEGVATKMQFEHANLAGTSQHDYLSGWQRTFLKLEKMFATSVPQAT